MSSFCSAQADGKQDCRRRFALRMWPTHLKAGQLRYRSWGETEVGMASGDEDHSLSRWFHRRGGG